ncbi:MAG: asparaginase [Chloroflexi bacterium]|nr:asparaginase [Chloroflexota bacterium]
MSRVAVVFTGGTISMRHDAASGGAIPVLDGPAILARTPGVAEIADVEAIDWGVVPASHLQFPQLLDLARTVRGALDRSDVVGAVVVQGTDTIEEVAFALDLTHAGGKPIVVVGAMRTADHDGYDGPANLRDAVRCAAEAGLREQGVVVAMAGRILPADDVVKTDSEAYDTFRAPNKGALGAVRPDGVELWSSRRGRRTLAWIPEAAAEPIHPITATVAMDGTLVRLARQAGARGFVIAATGVGNTDPRLLEECRRAMDEGIPVVLATRCSSGRTAPLYAFPGGGVTWERAGALFAGTLSAAKARVALALGLGAGLDDNGLRALFRDDPTPAPPR